MVHVHHTVLQALDRPAQEFIKRARRGKIELRQLAPERGPIERRHDAAAPDALSRLVQRPRKLIVQAGTGLPVRKQRRGRRRQVAAPHEPRVATASA